MILNSRKKFIFAVLSGIILSCGWFQNTTGLIIFFGFVPLLLIEDFLDCNKKDYRSIIFFLYSFLSFLIWNILNTWWIFNATFFGVMAVIIYNSLLMSIVMWLFHVVKRNHGNLLGYLSFVIFWLGFEKYSLSSELSWPWLHLGNAFANNIKLIQWYEFTGVHGGSLWVLIVNLLIFSIIKKLLNNRNDKKMLYNSLMLIAFIFIPIIFSIFKFAIYHEKGERLNVALLQPNINPYNNIHTELSKAKILNIISEMSKTAIDSSIDYIIAPENAINDFILEPDISSNKSICTLKSLLKNYPKLNYIFGTSTYKLYNSVENISTTSRKLKGNNMYYDSFNSAIQINSLDSVFIYHKSKLVTGVEKMPFPKLISYFSIFIEKMGGFPGSLGTQKKRSVFPSSNKHTNIAPIICYESVYGEFVNGFVLNGANVLTIITNDGWWGNTPGYKQHLSYSRIRAIETRRSIMRAASTGISAIINQKGEIIGSSIYGKRLVLKGNINCNNKLTFYVKNGDYIGRISIYLSLIILVYTFGILVINSRKKLKYILK